MQIVKTIDEVRKTVKAWKKEGLTVGLVPTMGYLHEGHKSLIEPKTRSEVIEITNVFRAKIVDISPNTLTIELTGHNTKLNAFIDLVEPYGIEEIARTGMTALERGANTLKLDK